MKKLALIASLMCGLMVIGNAPAQTKVTTYRAFTLYNTSKSTIWYEVNWGKGPSQRYTLAPGAVRGHAQVYERNTFPTPLAPSIKYQQHAYRTDWYVGPVHLGTKIITADMPLSAGALYKFSTQGGGTVFLGN